MSSKSEQKKREAIESTQRAVDALSLNPGRAAEPSGISTSELAKESACEQKVKHPDMQASARGGQKLERSQQILAKVRDMGHYPSEIKDPKDAGEEAERSLALQLRRALAKECSLKPKLKSWRHFGVRIKSWSAPRRF